MRVYNRLRVSIFALALVGSMLFSIKVFDLSAVHGENKEVRIFGLVDNPLNLSYSDLFSFPMVSETINLECVFRFPNVTLNWTGVPLFHLLTLAQVMPEGREVVFRAPDGFSSSLTMDEALQPNVILALKANGTLLTEVSQISNIQGGIRMVVPCKWGYKWVSDIQEIEVIDYDYKGTYESSGFSDEADIPECNQPEISPPLRTFTFPFGNRTFEVRVFTNISLLTLNFNYHQTWIDLNVTVLHGKTGFATVILEQAFLKGPYSVSIDGDAFYPTEANVTELSFLHFDTLEGSHTVRIFGTKFFGTVPEIRLRANQTVFIGEIVTFDASMSIDDGQIVSYEWDLGDGTRISGATVNHTYNEEGTYSITVNLTDNEGLTSHETFEINVQNRTTDISIITKILLGSIFGLVILLIIILILRRRKEGSSIQGNDIVYR